MNENLPTNVQLDANGNGTVSFATDVIATIAGLAATEVEGVASMYGGAGGFADIFTRRGQSSSRSLTKGVRVELNENQISVHLTIIVDYGSPVPEVARNIQENVKKAIETMSGLGVTDVDVHVQGVSFERENRAAAEIEMRQRLLLQKQQDERERTKESEQAPAKDADEPAAEANRAAEQPENEGAEAGADADDEGEYELPLDDPNDPDEGARDEGECEAQPDNLDEDFAAPEAAAANDSEEDLCEPDAPEEAVPVCSDEDPQSEGQDADQAPDECEARPDEDVSPEDARDDRQEP